MRPDADPARARHIAAALVLAIGSAAHTARLAAQEGCEYLPPTVQVNVQGSVTYVGRPHFLCDDGIEVWADSLVNFVDQDLSVLMGRVRFIEGERELRSDSARYYGDEGRLRAQGSLYIRDESDGSEIRNGDLLYLRRTDRREQEQMTVTTGVDGVRPVALLTPRADSAEVGAPPPTPYRVVGDRIDFSGSEYFRATGRAEIERDSLLAFADTAEYREGDGTLLLQGSARIDGTTYDLVGRTITVTPTETGGDEIRARVDAELTGEDLDVVAQLIVMFVADGQVERLVGTNLPPEPTDAPPVAATAAGTGAGAPARPAQPTAPATDLGTRPGRPTGAAPPRGPSVAESPRQGGPQPRAVSDAFELTADSLDMRAPAGVVELVHGVGRARSVSLGRDSLNVDVLLPVARTDWLEGDTIVIYLIAPDEVATTDATVAPEGSEGGDYRIERIEARVDARSLYRLPPSDSTAVAGVDAPAVSYMVAREITIFMDNGQVDRVESLGQVAGVHLEPLSPVRVGASDETPQSDSIGTSAVNGTDTTAVPVR